MKKLGKQFLKRISYSLFDVHENFCQLAKTDKLYGRLQRPSLGEKKRLFSTRNRYTMCRTARKSSTVGWPDEMARKYRCTAADPAYLCTKKRTRLFKRIILCANYKSTITRIQPSQVKPPQKDHWTRQYVANTCA